jgi:hypothetical protein
MLLDAGSVITNTPLLVALTPAGDQSSNGVLFYQGVSTIKNFPKPNTTKAPHHF